MSRHHSIATALAVLFLAAPLAAQGVTHDSTTAAQASIVAHTVEAAPVSLSPTAANAIAGIRPVAVAPALAPAPAPRQERMGRNPAMMIVGGVALIAGSFIDGDSGSIVMIAGGALGLYGLWQYLK